MIDRARVRELAAHDANLDRLESALAGVEAELDAMGDQATAMQAALTGPGDPLGRLPAIVAGLDWFEARSADLVRMMEFNAQAVRELARYRKILAGHPASPRNRKVVARINRAVERLQEAAEQARDFTAAVARVREWARHQADSPCFARRTC